MSRPTIVQLLVLIAITCGTATYAVAQTQAEAKAQQEYRQKISNSMANCSVDSGPAIKVTVTGIKAGGGTLRVQSYNGNKTDWLKKGRWLSRIESEAEAGSMTFCLPVVSSGIYAVAVRHDVNGNNNTDLFEDGGAMSNDPSINIWNLGKPSYKKTAFTVRDGVEPISVKMKYW